jgi:signal peptidase II
MAARESSHLSLTFALAVAVIVADQATKWLILDLMQPPRLIEITGFFNLVLAYNRGVAFSFLASGLAWKPYLLAGIAILVSIALTVWVARQKDKLLALAGGAIVGGALGNAIDRFTQPGVVDFLDFHAMGYHWPAFNVADSFIVCGVAVLVWDGLFNGSNQRKTSNEVKSE